MITLAWWQIVGALLLAVTVGGLFGWWLAYEADHALDEPRLVDDDVRGDDD